MMHICLTLLHLQFTDAIRFSVSPSVLRKTGDLVTVTWSNVSSPLSTDLITLSSATNTFGQWEVTLVSTWHSGSGVLSDVPMVNLREKLFFAYMHNGTKLVEKASVSFANPSEITQLHLALTHNCDEMIVHFVNDERNVTPYVDLRELDQSGAPVGQIVTFQGISLTYNASDMCSAPATANVGFTSPGVMHEVQLSGLAPATLYEYRAGTLSGNAPRTHWRRFVSAPVVGANTSVDFLMFGDMGVRSPFNFTKFWTDLGEDQQFSAVKTVPLLKRYMFEGIPGYNVSLESPFSERMSAGTHRRLARRFGSAMTAARVTPRLIFEVGDISYARGLSVLWDYFMTSIEDVAASAPWMVSVGNHDYDYPNNSFKPTSGDDSLGECGIPYSARFHMPPPVKGQPAPWNARGYWYGFEFGPVHFVSISTEHDFTAGSEQPIYSSDGGCLHSPMRRLLQDAIEPLLIKYHVDVVVVGHVHAYERSCGIASQGECAATDEDGTVHLTVGGAGNDFIEGWDDEKFASHKLSPPWIVFRTVSHGISEFRVNGTTLEMVFISCNRGEVHDRLILQK